MKVYNGWIIKAWNNEYKVVGSVTIRGKQSYTLEDTTSGQLNSIPRESLLKNWGEGVTYVKSVAP